MVEVKEINQVGINMKKLSDLDKHLKKFDEISIDPEVTDIDKLIEQYDDIILENPKEEQIREYYENQVIDTEFLDEQYLEMGKKKNYFNY
mgnify:CR=1 FL=1